MYSICKDCLYRLKMISRDVSGAPKWALRFFLAKFIFFENHHNSYAICYKLVLIPKYAIKSKMTPWMVS